MRVIRTKPFDKDYTKLTINEQKQVRKALRHLINNPRHPSLQSHKLEGTPYIDIYVNMDIRIVYEVNRDDELLVLQAVGHHDVLRKF